MTRSVARPSFRLHAAAALCLGLAAATAHAAPTAQQIDQETCDVLLGNSHPAMFTKWLASVRKDAAQGRLDARRTLADVAQNTMLCHEQAASRQAAADHPDAAAVRQDAAVHQEAADRQGADASHPSADPGSPPAAAGAAASAPAASASPASTSTASVPATSASAASAPAAPTPAASTPAASSPVAPGETPARNPADPASRPDAPAQPPGVAAAPGDVADVFLRPAALQALREVIGLAHELGRIDPGYRAVSAQWVLKYGKLVPELLLQGYEDAAGAVQFDCVLKGTYGRRDGASACEDERSMQDRLALLVPAEPRAAADARAAAWARTVDPSTSD